MRVTFIGLGQMGKGIAENIMKGGFDVTVWNRKDACWPHLEELARKGAKTTETIADAVKDADIVGMSLTSDTAVKSVVDDISGALKTGAIVIDHSTTSPRTAREMAATLAKRKVSFLDAPVSGGAQGAAAGNLTVMAGGDKETFERAYPVLKKMGAKVVFMGPSGAGQVTKLVNQMLTGVNQAIICEAMIIGEKAGLEMNTLYNVLATAWGSSRMLERSVPQYIIPRMYESAACLELMLKDFDLAVQVASEMGLNVPLTDLSRHYYQAAKDEGMGKMDHSYIIEVMKRENAVN